MTEKDTPLRGRIMRDQQGFWVKFEIEGQPMSIGPLPTLEGARAAARDVVDVARRAYEEAGYTATPRYQERGGSS